MYMKVHKIKIYRLAKNNVRCEHNTKFKTKFQTKTFLTITKSCKVPIRASQQVNNYVFASNT